MPDRRIHLPAEQMPTAWYNIMADMPEPPAPYLHPGTQQPLTPDALTPIFPMALIEQEVSTTRWIDIPGEVIDVFRQFRPSPLHRAIRLERALGTPARIYYKYEGVSPAGSHKPNTAIPQAWYNKQAGIKRLATETASGVERSRRKVCGVTLVSPRLYFSTVRVLMPSGPARRLNSLVLLSP